MISKLQITKWGELGWVIPIYMGLERFPTGYAILHELNLIGCQEYKGTHLGIP